MHPCIAISLILSNILVLFSALIVGLVRHNVLMDPVFCCAEKDNHACTESLEIQQDAFYNPVTGLRLRYIIATCFFFVSILQRSLTLPPMLLWIQHRYLTLFVGLTSFTTMLLFGDTANRFFTTVNYNLIPECDSVSVVLINAINVLSWFVQLISCMIFYLFIVTEESTISSYALPILKLDNESQNGEEEEIYPITPNAHEKLIIKQNIQHEYRGEEDDVL